MIDTKKTEYIADCLKTINMYIDMCNRDDSGRKNLKLEAARGYLSAAETSVRNFLHCDTDAR